MPSLVRRRYAPVSHWESRSVCWVGWGSPHRQASTAATRQCQARRIFGATPTLQCRESGGPWSVAVGSAAARRCHGGLAEHHCLVAGGGGSVPRGARRLAPGVAGAPAQERVAARAATAGPAHVRGLRAALRGAPWARRVRRAEALAPARAGGQGAALRDPPSGSGRLRAYSRQRAACHEGAGGAEEELEDGGRLARPGRDLWRGRVPGGA
mmetsp:Transcript_99109/g.275972  ORF Transcript_99109/g.275972 Transcript_99109/m.275972 type:complete len:211 (+) Transcript_99109:119-751(+)